MTEHKTIGAFCPACGERVRASDPNVQRDDVRWHLACTTGAHDPVERPGAELTPPERPMFPDPATGAMREPLRCQRCGMRLKPDGGCPDPGCTWERHETRVAHARKVWTAPHR